MDEKLNENVQQGADEAQKALAARKEEKARLIAQKMAASSFEDEVIHGSGDDKKTETALKKATDAVNAVRERPHSKGATGEYPAQRDMARTRNSTGAQRRPSGSRSGRPSDARRPSGARRAPARRKKKSKAPLIVCCSILIAIVVGCGIAYLVGLGKYKDKFLDNTFINNIDVSGKTKEEVYSIVKEKSTLKDSFTLTRLDGTVIQIPLKDIGYEDKTQYEIETFYNSQNHYNWIGAKFNNTQFELKDKFTYDKVLLENLLKKKLTSASSGKQPENASIQKSSDGTYVIVKEKPGDKINVDKIQNLYDFVESNLDNNIYVIDVSDVDCYESAKITSDSLKDECEKLNKMNQLTITFDFIHSQEVLKGDEIMKWVSFDSKSKDGIVVDTKLVETYVEGLAKKYDTYGIDRQFKTTKKGVITIKGGNTQANDTGCYGWWIDQQKTIQLIKDTIIAGQSITTKPVYYQNPNSHYTYACDESVWTKDKDYGDTYVEIDIAAQHLWHYVNGKVVKEFDFVSGYLYDKNRYTREGVFKVWAKQSPSRLKGEGWDVKVQYWINFSLYGAGFHDATWQYGVFGGSKYKTSAGGSHGCINLSPENAKYIYNNVAINTPVFIYNIENPSSMAVTKPN